MLRCIEDVFLNYYVPYMLFAGADSLFMQGKCVSALGMMDAQILGEGETALFK